MDAKIIRFTFRCLQIVLSFTLLIAFEFDSKLIKIYLFLKKVTTPSLLLEKEGELRKKERMDGEREGGREEGRGR